jgi:hypothetical protein
MFELVFRRQFNGDQVIAAEHRARVDAVSASASADLPIPSGPFKTMIIVMDNQFKCPRTSV